MANFIKMPIVLAHLLWDNMVALLILLLLSSCISTEVLNAPEEVVEVERMKKPHKPLPQRDTAEVDDTARYSIGFEPTVEDWDESSVEM